MENKHLFRLLILICTLITGCSGQARLLPQSAAETSSPKMASSTFPLIEKWCLETSSSISFPTFASGLIYVVQPTNEENSVISSYDQQGNKIWSVEIGDLGWAALPGYWSFQDQYLVTGSSDSIIVLDTKTGLEVWQAGVNANRGMTVGDGKVFMQSNEWVWAFDLKTGGLIWKVSSQGRLGAQAPIYFEDNGKKQLLIDHKAYQILDAQTGKQLYETAGLQSDLHGNIGINKGFVNQGKYVLPFSDGLAVYDASRGTFLNSFHGVFNPLPQRLSAESGKLYLNTLTSVSVLDIHQLQEVWQTSIDIESKDSYSNVYSSPVVFEDHVYVVLADGSLLALSLEDGKPVGKWQGERVKVAWGSLTPYFPGFAVGERTLFVTFGTDKLCAFIPDI